VKDSSTMPLVVAGIVANPASGRDIRRLTSSASVFPTAEKAQMVQRLLGAFGRFGVDRVLMMRDTTGISALVVRTLATRDNERDGRWPQVSFVEMPVTESVTDTYAAVDAMRAAGVSLIVRGLRARRCLCVERAEHRLPGALARRGSP
jgi:predicted polyphosphate/ATP-dependent NAD kinase